MHPIIFIMGVSGSGKTTVGLLLSQQTGIPFFDADDFHSAENKAKMAAGHPLNDDDRKDWLITLNSLAIKAAAGKGAIIACSALKQKYRLVLQQGLQQSLWIFLKGRFEQIYQRLQSRDHHFMPPALLQSQFDILEIPEDALVINIEQTPGEAVAKIQQHLQQRF